MFAQLPFEELKRLNMSNMHILYITSNLPRPHEPGPARPWIQAVFMARSGHNVSIITNQRTFLTDAGPLEVQKRKIYYVREEGMDILSVPTIAGRHLSMKRRILFYLSFAFMSLYEGLKVRDVDLIYVRTPPLLICISGWILAKLKRAKLVLALGDLHPEVAVEVGMIKSTFLIRLWEAIENFQRRRADLLVAILPGIKDILVAKGFSPENIWVSTNAYDPIEERQEPLPIKTNLALEEVKNCFLVMYTGALTKVTALDVALKAALLIQENNSQIKFVIVGEGERLPYLRKLAEDLGIHNVLFLDPVPRNSMATLLKRANVVMNLYYKGNVHGVYELPNKFFEYLGSGKPIIYSGLGEIARIVKEVRCGIVVAPEDHQAFAEAITYLWKNQNEAREMGQRGRQYVMKKFNRKKILMALNKKLEELVQNKNS